MEAFHFFIQFAPPFQKFLFRQREMSIVKGNGKSLARFQTDRAIDQGTIDDRRIATELFGYHIHLLGEDAEGSKLSLPSDGAGAAGRPG